MMWQWRRLANFVKVHRVGVALALIMLLAIYFRFWHLWDLPPGLHPDEAANGLDIFRIQEGDLRPLYNTNGPRESLFFFLQAIFVTIFGNTVLALRIAPALIGVVAVWLTYLWVKEWFSTRVALLAAFIMASAPWAVTITRDGFRASMMPMMVALSAWLFTKSVKTGRWYWYALSGLSVGAGLYTYISFRMVPVIAGLLFVHAMVFYRKKIRKLILPLVLVGVFAAVALVPMGLYTLNHRDEVLGARSSVSITNSELNGGKPLQTLVSNLGKTALMFNFKGDQNYRHNLGGAPMMDAFIGIAFVLGVLLALRRFKDIRYFALLAIVALMLVPEILTAEGIPHALRAIGVLPAIYVLAAVGISELMARWHGVFPRNPAAYNSYVAIVVVLLGLSTSYNYQRYFVAWANDPKTFEAYSEDSTEIGKYLISHPFNGQRYVVIDSYSNITVSYLAKNKTSYVHLEASGVGQVASDVPTQVVVVNTQVEATSATLADKKFKNIATGISDKRPSVVLYRVYENGQPQ